ncbi:alkylglycerol monooxygenase-like [Maniola jurtina]|uniref:alkylglycerol monooxygenase-like n=1 Tax=Maniola jurtina TaxID=191418 RepID=UPI001E68E5AD|nr:alkylglycerol monooxygenase-like [Maniola jurtina]XP_045765345.1 alkylglycerol monooxygenase-like [Maniola jurtina]XP_045765346.1 alkylglycerol monooxygenase-like [Maniola jurtina]
MAAEMSFANATADTGFSDVFANHMKGLGRMFYIHSPKEQLYEKVEDVPNFFRQSYPYFLIFMIIEHIVLRLEGKKGIRLNDGITSISHGIFQECGRLIWRGAESYLYTWIYCNFRIVELPWNNTLTWYAAALGVDFCYYWMHRACHEVHILWAQHQVHHTSEDFNMGVGIRQSVLQGWCGFIFYLPLALAIPPAQFVMHHQFSYLYMFWIHTETIKSLGPLEYILNTPSHHRVHHGSNKYCLDVNYGGVLIIWDRLFGTFRPETDKIEIIYGLIYNQPSFNPAYLQSFYTRYVIQKCRRLETWSDKLKAVVWGPSWEPGTPRLGDEDMKVEVENRPKYDVLLPAWCNTYIVLHYAVVLYGFFELASRYMGMTPLSVIVFVFYVMASLTIIGMIFDNSKYAPMLEVVRCSALAFLTRSLATSPLLTALQMFYVVSAMFWCLHTLKLLEIKKKVD